MGWVSSAVGRAAGSGSVSHGAGCPATTIQPRILPLFGGFDAVQHVPLAPTVPV